METGPPQKDTDASSHQITGPGKAKFSLFEGGAEWLALSDSPWRARVRITLATEADVTLHPGLLTQVNTRLCGRIPLSFIDDNDVEVRFAVHDDSPPNRALIEAAAAMLADMFGHSRIDAITTALVNHELPVAEFQTDRLQATQHLQIVPDEPTN